MWILRLLDRLLFAPPDILRHSRSRALRELLAEEDRPVTVGREEKEGA